MTLEALARRDLRDEDDAWLMVREGRGGGFDVATGFRGLGEAQENEEREE